MTGVPGGAPAGPPPDCPSCGSPLTGSFCSECGERRPAQEDRSVLAFLRRGLAEVLDVRSTLHRDLRALLLRPGRLTLEFVRGRRVLHVHPFRLFLFANLVYFLVQPLTPYTGYNTTLASQMDRQPYSEVMSVAERVEAEVERREVDVEVFRAAYDGRSSTLARALVVLMVPMLAAVLALLFADRGRPLLDHLVLATHYYAFELLFLMSIFLFAWGWISGAMWEGLTAVGVTRGSLRESGDLGAAFVHLVSEMPTAPFVLAWTYAAVRRVFEVGRPRALASAVALWVALGLITFAYRLVLFEVTFRTI